MSTVCFRECALLNHPNEMFYNHSAGTAACHRCECVNVFLKDSNKMFDIPTVDTAACMAFVEYGRVCCGSSSCGFFLV